MSTVSPPKPWERAGAAANPGNPSNAPSTFPSTNATDNTAPLRTSSIPALPDRPNSLNSVVNQTASNYSNYGASRLGASGYGGYGGYGGYSSYSSPYSRFGGMGGMGGMGGVGGMYGGYGGGIYGGMGGMYGGGMGGMQANASDPNSLTNSFDRSTQATFQIIESIVGAFGGFAQMLESTYMATHSSFFAMVSVAEQFGNLRNTLGSVLGIFTLLRWLRTLFAKITGRPPPADAKSLNASAFASFLSGKSQADSRLAPTSLPDGTPIPPRPSKKPFVMFLLAVFGFPYLMGKLIRALARSREAGFADNNQLQQPNADQQALLDPSKVDFCRVLYDYTPPQTQTAGIDLAVKKGDLVGVLSKADPLGNPSEWWRCRTRDGRIGYLPSPYLEVMQRRPQQQAQITTGSLPGSRTGTLNTTASADTTATSIDADGDEKRKRAFEDRPGVGPGPGPGPDKQQQPPPPWSRPQMSQGKPGNLGPETFQKSAFYS